MNVLKDQCVHVTTQNNNKTFKDTTLLSASLSGSQNTGSIVFTALDTEYDRLLRYKFFGEKVCNTLGLPVNQWIYVDQMRLPADDESNYFEGNVNATAGNSGATPLDLAYINGSPAIIDRLMGIGAASAFNQVHI